MPLWASQNKASFRRSHASRDSFPNAEGVRRKVSCKPLWRAGQGLTRRFDSARVLCGMATAMERKSLSSARTILFSPCVQFNSCRLHLRGSSGPRRMQEACSLAVVRSAERFSCGEALSGRTRAGCLHVAHERGDPGSAGITGYRYEKQ
jgi:hypothetical protein